MYFAVKTHICNLMFLPSTSIILVPNSTPIVCWHSGMTTNVHQNQGKTTTVTFFFSKLMQQTTFSNTSITYYNILERVLVRTRHGEVREVSFTFVCSTLYEN